MKIKFLLDQIKGLKPHLNLPAERSKTFRTGSILANFLEDERGIGSAKPESIGHCYS